MNRPLSFDEIARLKQAAIINFMCSVEAYKSLEDFFSLYQRC